MIVNKNSSSPLQLQVSKTADQSYLAKLDKELEHARTDKAPLEVSTTHALKYFVPAVIIFALVIGILLGIFFPVTLAIQCSVAILVAACPCVLGFIVPLVSKVGLTKSSEAGAHFFH